MKKIISIMVIAAMTMSSVMVSFAGNDLSEVEVSQDMFNKAFTLEEMFDLYEVSGFEGTILNTTDNTMEYILVNPANPDLDTYVSASVDANGNQLLKITEGDKYDQLQMNTDGTMLMDNKPITIETAGEGIITPYAHSIRWTKTCPYGVSSDYSKLQETQSKSVRFAKAISAMTTAAFVAAIVAALGITGNPATVLTTAATGAIEYFSDWDPSSRALSIKESTYVHKTKGFTVSSSMSVYKKVMYYYANENYTGLFQTDTNYQVFGY